jgi:phosphatidylglycerophosphatase C
VKQTLALFDFDGTITYKDTLLEFIKFYKGQKSFYSGILFLSPILILFKLKLIKNWKAKEIFLSHFFKGELIEDFQNKCDLFCSTVVPGLLRPKALEKIKQHQQQGDKVIIVSASAENWISAWCATLSIELLATKLEVKSGRLTGKIEGANCYGPEKVIRVKNYLGDHSYSKIYAYGDSGGDRELLAYATNAHYRHF